MCKGLSQPKGRTGMGISCHWSRPGGPGSAGVSSGAVHTQPSLPAFPAAHTTAFLGWLVPGGGTQAPSGSGGA